MIMDKRTVIYDAESIDDPVDERDVAGKPSPGSGGMEMLRKFSKTGVMVSAGLAAGALGTYLAFKPDGFDITDLFARTDQAGGGQIVDILVDDNLQISAQVNDSMSFEEAFRIAREEVGGGGVFMWNGQMFGTYTQAEWENLSAAEQKDFFGSFSIQPYGESGSAAVFDAGDLQVATSVHDDMSFGEAFMTARDEVGASGVFYWHGQPYNTLYEEEWADMPANERDVFMSKVAEGNHESPADDGSQDYSGAETQNDYFQSGGTEQVFMAQPVNLGFGDSDQMLYAIGSEDEAVLSADPPDPLGMDQEITAIEPSVAIIQDDSLYEGLEFDKLAEKQADLNDQIQLLQSEAESAGVQSQIHKLAGIVDIGQQILNVGVDFGLVPGFASKIYDRIFVGAHLARDVGDSIQSLNDNI